MAEVAGRGFGVVRVRVADIPPEIHVVLTHPPEQPNDRLRMAHAELRFPDPRGGVDLPLAIKRKLARLAGGANMLIAPAAP